jgi:NADP-dependent 3-hydroxy acid dehydrogenase YdfG
MKKAIVVGATSGLGRSLALMLAADNYQVGITGRRAALLDELAGQAPHSFIAEVCDVTDTGSITGHLDKLVDTLGGLDLLLLCAGTGEVNHELDFSIEKMTIDTNVTGFTAVCDWAFNLFRARVRGIWRQSLLSEDCGAVAKAGL